MNLDDGLRPVAKAYGTILADPPWRFANRTGKVSPEHGRLRRYATMGAADVAAVPVAAWADRRSHCYLWVPNALLPDGLAVLAAWGFRYKACLVWEKVRRDGLPDGRGVGFYFRNATETVLFGIRGGLRTSAAARSQVNVVREERREHSRKPEALYGLIERCSPCPRLELFARRIRPGWDGWGDEIAVAGAVP
jgi:N6-adenosine-specific RNA methylase IME4